MKGFEALEIMTKQILVDWRERLGLAGPDTRPDVLASVRFLNLKATNRRAMWRTYNHFSEVLYALEERLAQLQIHIEVGSAFVEPLARQAFLETYDHDFLDDVTKVQRGIAGLITEKGEDLRETLTTIGGESRAEAVDSVRGFRGTGWPRADRYARVDPSPLVVSRCYPSYSGKEITTVRYGALSYPNFWLHLIIEAAVVGGKAGAEGGIRICAAPDCGDYYYPTPRGQQQRFHSGTCKSRYYARKRRAAASG